MIRSFKSSFIAVLALPVLCSAGELVGKWTSEFDTQIGRQSYVFDFQKSGDKLTGKAIGKVGGEKHETDLVEITVKDDDVQFVENLEFQGQPLKITYTGKLSADEMKLTRNVADFAKKEIVAKREVAKK